MSEDELVAKLKQFMHASAGGIWVHEEGREEPPLQAYFTVHKLPPANIDRIHALSLIPVARHPNAKAPPVVMVSSNDAGITRALMSFTAMHNGITTIRRFPGDRS